ncbi:hypothetical protein GW17_00016281 [Ensete ventricosum]|nr:hypothetical protein GW17_00016281 [Ensete ventricosum]
MGGDYDGTKASYVIRTQLYWSPIKPAPFDSALSSRLRIHKLWESGPHLLIRLPRDIFVGKPTADASHVQQKSKQKSIFHVNQIVVQKIGVKRPPSDLILRPMCERLILPREIVYPYISDPDGEDEGGQVSSSLAVSTRWISIAKLLLSDLVTLAQREGGE